MLAISLSGVLLGRQLAPVEVLVLATPAIFLLRLSRPLVRLDLAADGLGHVKLGLLGRQLLQDFQIFRFFLVGVLNERIKLAFLTLRLHLKE